MGRQSLPAYQAQFADLGVLEPLDGLGIEDADHQPGLAAGWLGPDGHRHGAPKDWDTVALFYNEGMAKDAGLSADELNGLSRNPGDGGTYEKAVAHLTVDEQGRRGEKGVDVSAFTRPVDDPEGFRTFTYPITDHAADVLALMQPAMQDVYGGGKPVTSLDAASDQINLILDQ